MNTGDECHSPSTIGGSPVSMYVYVEDVDELFNKAVSAGAKVLDPVKDQFWGDHHGRTRRPIWTLVNSDSQKRPLRRGNEKSGRSSFFSNVKVNFHLIHFPSLFQYLGFIRKVQYRQIIPSCHNIPIIL